MIRPKHLVVVTTGRIGTMFCKKYRHEPCVDDDVNRECYAGEQSHPPQVAVKEEEADVVYQNMDCNTNEIFISVEELMAWVKSRAIDNGYVVVTGRSKKKKGTNEVYLKSI
ncbi:hypothetical protein E3N88_44263 [Mikania micrantha]|uniref:Uncharacterized protein n=1 Tax=Mikania micrantha TaxID=192012 RepID=A0A5N6LCH8_9ASTR|nr:hypothetical protein E3N88_44263 [Mikania micrantha]